MLNEKDRDYWIIDWLQRHGPPEWHAYVEQHKWDGYSTAPLDWIVAQPLCDAATAATIFWLSEPDYYLNGSHDDDAVAQLDLAIVRRWRADGFPAGRFSFDEGSRELIEKINTGPHKVPPSLADPIEGQETFPWFRELPHEIERAWHAANGREPPAHLLAPDVPAEQVPERPGKMSKQEMRRIWAALGPSSAFGRPGPLTRVRRWLGRV